MTATKEALEFKGRKIKMPSGPRAQRKPPDYNVERDGVTQSMLSTWVRCRQHMAYVLDGWERPEPKRALVFGSLWHWLLEQAYEAVRNGTVESLAFDDLAEQWLAEHAGEVGDAQLLELMLAWADGLWEGYWREWGDDDLAREWAGVESQFDIGWQGYRLRGMRDGLFSDDKDRPWLLETKTASRVDDDSLMTMLPINFQNLFYLTACRAEGFDAKRVLYNVVRKPQLRQKGGESLRDYTERIRGDVEKRPEFYFHRFEARYTVKQLRAFQKQLLQKLNAFSEWDRARATGDDRGPAGWTYRNESACFGRWVCPFLQACSSGGSMEGYVRTRRLFRELE